MTEIYDNWERLVAAVLRREQFRQLCFDHSRTPSNISSTVFSLISSPLHEILSPDFSRSSSSHQQDHRAESDFQGESASINSSRLLMEAVLEVGISDDKQKRKAMTVVSSFYGIDSIYADMTQKRIYVAGDFDPVGVVLKLRKSWHSEILYVKLHIGVLYHRVALIAGSVFRGATASISTSPLREVVLRVDLHDDEGKRKAMRVVSSFSGLESIKSHSLNKNLTVTGNIDPVAVTAKLRMLFHTELLSVGPAAEDLGNNPEDPINGSVIL